MKLKAKPGNPSRGPEVQEVILKSLSGRTGNTQSHSGTNKNLSGSGRKENATKTGQREGRQSDTGETNQGGAHMGNLTGTQG